jgi:hypothetical protein
MRAYMVSLLKSWWGPAASPENDFCFDYLPRLTGSHSTYETPQRLLQFHYQAVEPPGEARSDLWFNYHLGRRSREKLADPTVRAEETRDIIEHLGHTADEMDQPIRRDWHLLVEIAR